MRTEGFNEWCDLAAAFTVRSFQQWQWFSNSIHYLLGLWGRLIAAIPYVPQQSSSSSSSSSSNGGSGVNFRENMQRCVLQVAQSYIKYVVIHPPTHPPISNPPTHPPTHHTKHKGA